MRTTILKIKSVYSFFILFAITSVIATSAPDAFADHSEITIVPVTGSQAPGCEDLDGCYSPSIATVEIGGKVIFSNTDSASHTFTGGNAVDGLSEIFDSGLLPSGKSFTLDTTGLELV